MIRNTHQTDPEFYSSLWYETAAPEPETSPLESDVTTDVIIIGGGFTGMSTALHLGRRGIRSAVLESRSIGFGGSGRNQGHCTPTFMFYKPSSVVSELGPVFGPRMVDLQSNAANLVFSLIAEHGIDCEASQNGFVQAAHMPDTVDRLKGLVEEYSRIGQNCRFLDRQEIAEITGSTRYYGGWFLDSGGHVNPLGYVRGLARAAMENGAEVYTNSPVVLLDRDGTKWLAKTERGCVRGDRVVIATDAYSGDLLSRLRRSVFLMTSYNLATPPLPPEVLESILPRRNHVADTRRDTQYYRLDTAGRFVTGSVVSGRRGMDVEYSMHKMRERIQWIFPQIGELDWKWFWRGNISMTPNLLPRVFDVAPGVVSGLGYSGRGVPTATAMGRLLASLTAGDPPADQPIEVKPLKPLLARSMYGFIAPQLLKVHRVRDYVDQARQRLSFPYF